MTIEMITSAALALPPESRAVLAEALLDSLDPSDDIISSDDSTTFREEWEREIEDRIDAFERGEVQAIPLDEVMRSIGTKHHDD
jgi:putative addiction module component (TIGR02574 family)